MNYSKYLLCILVCLFFANCKTKEENHRVNVLSEFSDHIGMEKTKREYLILKIDTTKRYYLFESINNNDSIILVVYKKSKQLKGKQVFTGNSYKFETYNRLDIIPNLDYFHDVDGVEVWNSSENKEIGLHFTDGMGNGGLESILEISDLINN
jgi:hypothetical protein